MKKEKIQIKRILDYLKGIGEWQSTSSIAEITGIHYYRAEKLLNGLFSRGLVEKDEKGRFVFWKLKEK